MNCKAGDLAIIINVDDPRCRSELGRIVKVIALTKSWDNVDCWFIAKPFYTPGVGMCRGVADKDLKPIRGLPKIINQLKTTVKEFL